MVLRIALGSADKSITMATAVRTELRENEIFIYGACRPQNWVSNGMKHLAKHTVMRRRVPRLGCDPLIQVTSSRSVTL